MMKRRLAALGLALNALACEPAAERPADAPADAVPAAVDDPSPTDSMPLMPLADYIAEGAVAHGLTRAELIEHFGEPASVRVTATPNRHDPSVTDSVVELDYDGASYVYYVVTQGPGEILDAARISSNEHLRHANPGIGTRLSAIDAAYGAPVRSDGASVEYECRTCEVPEPVRFVIREGRVTRVDFDYYVD